MELAGLDHVRQRFHRNAIASRGEIVIQVVLEAHARANVARPLNRIQAFYRCGIDDGRSGAPKVVHRFHENRDNFRIGRLALIGLPQHADHGAVQSVADRGPRCNPDEDDRAPRR